MIDADLQSRLEHLCADGSIEAGDLAGTESALLSVLNTLGISYTKTDLKLELESPLALLNSPWIQSQLSNTNLLDGFEWRYQLLTESTNADVLQLFESSRKPSIAIAEMQTGGRGRRGRKWISAFAKNIISSIGMPKLIAGCNPGLLSIVTGLALIQALENSAISGVQLKWPNDLYYQNKKLGGILIESKMSVNQEYFFAIGFGINVMMSAEDMSAIPQPVTSVELIADNPVSRDTLLAEAIQQVVKAIRDFDQSSAAKIVDSFLARDAFKNQTICVNSGTDSIDGKNLGINDDGQLMVETAQGIRVYSAADISIRSIA